MKYHKAKLDMKKEERKELVKQLTALDRTIMGKVEGKGRDIIDLISACKPYRNKWGGREFASSEVVRGSIKKLMKLGMLEQR